MGGIVWFVPIRFMTKWGIVMNVMNNIPKSHLYVNAVDKSTLCKGCIGRLHFEKEEDY
jgi:hypothetical protein